jgi:hypothetical protein
MSTQIRQKGSWPSNVAHTGVAVAVTVVLLMAGVLFSAPARAADPCEAVKEYRKPKEAREAKRFGLADHEVFDELGLKGAGGTQ